MPARIKKMIIVCFMLHMVISTQAQWAQTKGPEGGTVFALASSSSKIFAATSGGGVLITSDLGAHWTTLSDDLVNISTLSLAVSGNTIFAGGTANMLRSVDNGITWTVLSQSFGGFIYAVTIKDNFVFAGSYGGGVRRSADNGNTWVSINTGLTSNQIRSFTVSGTSLFAATTAGVFRSVDNGDTWTQVNNGLTSLSVNVLAARGTNIFAGTENGIFLSTNNGDTWVEKSTGLTNTLVRSLEVSDPSAIYAGTNSGLFKSTNNGDTWVASSTGITDTNIYALLSNSNNLFAGSNLDGVFRSSDSAATWVAANTGFVVSSVRKIAVSGSTIFAAGYYYGIRRSLDQGEHWTTSGLTNNFVSALLINGTTILACSGSDVYRSTNNGDSWSLSSTGISAQVVSFAVSGSNIFAATNGQGMFRSVDDGNTWTQINTGLGATVVNAVAVAGTAIVAATETNGVYISTNNGNTWSASNSGITDTAIKSLASGTSLVAGTSTGKIFKSSDQGATWTSVYNLGSRITTIASSGNTILAAGFCNCFVASPDNGATWGFSGDLVYLQDIAIHNGMAYSGSSRSVFKRPMIFITSVAPYSISAGATVMITGIGFDSNPVNNVVKFNGLTASVTAASSTSLTVTVPAITGTESGTISITTGGNTVGLSGYFTVPRSFTGFSPSSGKEGDVITLTGTSFNATPSNNAVYFNGTLATVTTATSGQLQVVVPQNATSGAISIYTGGETLTNATNFVVNPAITGFSPTEGSVLTRVTVTGTSFSLTNTQAKLNGQAITLAGLSSTSLSFDVPIGSTTGKITVISNGITVVSINDFKVTPKVFGFIPSGGRVGKTVTITGSQFSTVPSENHVFFGGIEAVVISATATELVTTVPTGATTGQITVTIGSYSSISGAQFTVTYSQPLTITSISPASGPVGTLVTITGTGFSTQAGINLVKFHGAASNPATSYSATELKATVPPDATTGLLVVDVSGDQATSVINFTITVPKQDQAITFTAVDTKTLGDAAFALSATASSGLGVQFATTSDKVTLNGSTVTMVKAGSVTITASQPGNTTYNAAPFVNQTFCINPAKPTITLTGSNTENILLTSSATAGNQWFSNGIAIALATSATYKPTGAGIYKVQVTVETCTSAFSSDQAIIVTGDIQEVATNDVQVYPNPAKDKVLIKLVGDDMASTVRIMRMDGATMEDLTTKETTVEVNVVHYATGIYVVKIHHNGGVQYRKFIKQ